MNFIFPSDCYVFHTSSPTITDGHIHYLRFFVADTGLKARIGEIFLKIAQMQQEIISN